MPNSPEIRFPHRDLIIIGRWLLGVIMREPGACWIVGSVRRCDLCRLGAGCDRTTKDLDLLIPGPADGTDEGFTRLQRIVDLADPEGLLPGMAPNARGSFIRAFSGFKPGFKEVKGEIDLSRAERHPSFPRDQFDDRWWETAGHALLPMQIWRYVPGDQGNMGWCQLIRTGPNTEADPFGQACLRRWKDLSGGKSDQGFPYDASGKRYFVPTEQAAFELLQMRYLEPHERTASRVPSGAR